MSRAANLFKRFDGLMSETVGSKQAITRVNTASRYQPVEETEEPGSDGIVNEEEDEAESRQVQGAGVAEGHDKAPTYSEHSGDNVRFAAMGQGGIPFVCTGPNLSVDDGIRWVNARIKGFSKHPKARESYEEAVRRKHIAAHGTEFVNECKAKGGDMVKMELDMMMSPDAHSGIGDLNLLSKKSNVENISLDKNGNVSGKQFGVMSDELGNQYED